MGWIGTRRQKPLMARYLLTLADDMPEVYTNKTGEQT